MDKQDLEKPHTERWAYRRLYTDRIFALCTALYPIFRRGGFQAVSRSVAFFYALTQPAVRRVVRANLSLLRREPVTDSEALRVFVNFGATIADYVAVGAMPTEQALALCRDHQTGMEHLRDAMAGGRGVILATAHYSFFEFGTVVLGSMGLPVTIATLPEPSPQLTAWRAKWRHRWGAETIEIGADPFSSIQIIRSLEKGRCMAMLADRPIVEHGLPVELPNGRTAFSTSPALLSSMTGCAVVPVIVTRLPGGHYRITAKPPITARAVPREERKAEIESCTRAIAASLLKKSVATPRNGINSSLSAYEAHPPSRPPHRPHSAGGDPSATQRHRDRLASGPPRRLPPRHSLPIRLPRGENPRHDEKPRHRARHHRLSSAQYVPP